MKKAGCTALIIMSALIFVSAAVSADDEHDLTITRVMKKIRTARKVYRNEDIKPSKVNGELPEILGEAVMNERFPDPEDHDFMDGRMGVEGSENLKEMHVRIGYNYLRNRFTENEQESRRGSGGFGIMCW